MWFYKRASMFSPVHCVWRLVPLCVCGTSNFERFFFVGTIVLRYVLRYVLGAPDKPCGVGRADANPKLLLNDT